MSSKICTVIHLNDTFQGKQNLSYFEGICCENVGSKRICMHVLRMPPGARGTAHRHEEHETAIYILQGTVASWHGENLQEHLTAAAGEMIYVPAGTPHLPYNPSSDEEIIAIIARTDASEQESVVLMPELEQLDLVLA